MRVSVLIPVRNGAGTIGEAITTVLAQGQIVGDIVAVDDGSTDGTAEILDRFAGAGAPLTRISGPGSGIATALNLGLARCRNPLVARLDADDRMLPGRLERQAAIMASSPELLVHSTAVRCFGAGSQVLGVVGIPARRMADALCLGNPIPHPSVMLRRDAVLAVGGYDAAWEPAEDYELWLRLSRLGPLQHSEWIGTEYRLHAGQISSRRSVAQGLHTAIIATAAAIACQRVAPGSPARRRCALLAYQQWAARAVAAREERQQLAGWIERRIRRQAATAAALLGAKRASAAWLGLQLLRRFALDRLGSAVADGLTWARRIAVGQP